MDSSDGAMAIVKSAASLARAGDAEAFCRLIEPLQTRLLRQATALSRDVSAAEDLVAETLVEAWKSLARYDESCRFSTWLYAILLHRYQKSVRRARARPMPLAWLPIFRREQLMAKREQVHATELSPMEEIMQDEDSALLRQYIDRLSEKHREIILLRFYEDASLPDMARVLGCPPGTVKSRLHHALEQLRKMKMNLGRSEGDI